MKQAYGSSFSFARCALRACVVFLFNRTHHKDAKNLYYEALISCQAGKNFIRLSLGAHASSELTVSQLTEHARCVRSQEASSPVFGEIFLVAAGLLCVHRKEMKRWNQSRHRCHFLGKDVGGSFFFASLCLRGEFCLRFSICASASIQYRTANAQIDTPAGNYL